jgi:YEATS-Like-Associating Three TM/Sugar-specific transcriptional regulator TrmB
MSAAQQASNAADLNQAMPDSSSILIVLMIIAIGGAIGGFAAYLTAPKDAEKKEGDTNSLGRYMLLGLMASGCVPLFLSLVQSDLVKGLFGTGRSLPFEKYLVFLGLCLIAAFSARTFLESVSRRVLRDLENVKEKQENIAQQVQEAVEIADETRAKPIDATRQAAAVAQVDSADLPGTNELERRALGAMTKTTFRTATGIAIDVGIPRSQIGEVLDSLADKGLIVLTQSPTTKGARWKIAPQGIAALNQAGEG